MSIDVFHPDPEQEFLIMNALRGHPEDVLPRTLLIDEIHNSRLELPRLKERGIDYVVAFEDHQAFNVLQHSPWASEIARKIAIPYSVSIFELREEPRDDYRDNPEDEEESLLTEEDLAPPIEWFEQFRKRYSDWPTAWWREVLQNSVDACLEAYDKFGRRGEIICSIYTYEDSDAVRVVVTDNGIGMNLDTLKNAFLKPGGSGKRDGDSGGRQAAGGLGKAKEMLYHAWPEWSVWTQTDGGKGYYVKARYGPYMKGNLLESKKRQRGKPGTTVSVLMKEDMRVTKNALRHFIDLSSFPQIRVIYREYAVSSDGEETLKDEEVLEAKNNVWLTGQSPSSSQPVRTLLRKDGSPWAEIYHLKTARNFKQIVIRANGLYLFSASQKAHLKGKVIIELKYKPKGKRWDRGEDQWIDLSPEEAAGQKIDDYGPLEMLTESRDGLLGQWPWSKPVSYRSELDDLLDEIAKRPEVALKKKKRKKRVRAINRYKDTPDFDILFEEIEPKEMLEDPQKNMEAMKRLSEDEILRRLARAIRNGDVDTRDPDSLNAQFTAGDIEILKRLMKMPDIRERLLKAEGKEPAEGSPKTGRWSGFCEECEPGQETPADLRRNPELPCKECGKLVPIIYGSGGASLDEDDELDIEEISEAVDNATYSAVSASVSSDLYDLYNDILGPIFALKRKEGKSTNYSKNVIKMLKWEPDFIMTNETEPPTPAPPNKYSPEFFGPKEKQIAKFWIECIRLVHMIQGVANLDLDVGFLFEDPGSDAFLGEYLSEPENNDDDEYTTNIGGFKAAFIAPADISGKTGGWVHRYSLRERRSVADLTSIAFHEVVHAELHRLDPDDPDSHGSPFASMLTKDLALAMVYSAAFFKLAKYCASLYPARIKGQTRPTILKPEKFRGYYEVRMEGKRGRKPRFRLLKDAFAAVRKHLEEEDGRYSKIIAHYWSDRDNHWVASIGTYYDLSDFPSPEDIDDIVKQGIYEANTEFDEDVNRGYYKRPEGLPSDETIFSRRRLRRRNP